jgi:hypothetical protein
MWTGNESEELRKLRWEMAIGVAMSTGGGGFKQFTQEQLDAFAAERLAYWRQVEQERNAAKAAQCKTRDVGGYQVTTAVAPACERCRWFVEDLCSSETRKTEAAYPMYGQCHKNAPVASECHPWPTVWATDWCGEFEPKGA